MKRVVVLLITLLSLLGCHQQVVKTANRNWLPDIKIENHDLKGNVKMCRTIDEYEDYANLGTQRDTTVSYFNTQGYLSSVSYINITQRTTTYFYDETSRLIGSKSLFSSDNRTSEDSYSYDERGLLTEIKSVERTGATNHHLILKYDDKGRCIEEQSYLNEEASPIFSYKTEYDDKGNTSSTTVYGTERELKRIEFISYDSEGKKIETTDTFYTSEGGESHRLKTTYNKQELPTIVEEHRNGSLHAKNVYIYDDSDREKEIISYEMSRDGELTISNRSSYDYDDKGNLIKMVTYSGEGEEIYSSSSTYAYDKNGNWISKTTTSYFMFEGGKESSSNTIRRTIEYYE
ncbi:hypothetical protein [Porphyromonas sp.]|uniref:hypothetical protein n=1 Tax=Porphyromonas sp. TaxID=1924944 RepID=UPI0026DC6F04|nr:hypothetical protein [Porphyromonas sp.]MDO4770766.1 hypothetical protein [Porphyromonas sp.]